MERAVLCLVLVVSVSCAVKRGREPLEWDDRWEAEKVNTRGCANLTNVLDNWKSAIVTQFRNLLLYDHQAVLPDYGRIKSLAEALDDLYKEFGVVKERLGDLTSRFHAVEAFVDRMDSARQIHPPARPPPVTEKSYVVPALQLKPGILTNPGTPRRRVRKGKSLGNPS